MTRRRRAFGLECQLEMMDDPVDNLMVFDERDDPHPADAGWTQQRINFIHLADHLGPAFGRHIGGIIFYDERIRRISPCLTYLPPMGIGVEAAVADHDVCDT